MHYSFCNLKVVDLRTGIDFETLITNHTSSYVVLRNKTCRKTCLVVHVFSFSVMLRVSPGLCTLEKCP